MLTEFVPNARSQTSQLKSFILLCITLMCLFKLSAVVNFNEHNSQVKLFSKDSS